MKKYFSYIKCSKYWLSPMMKFMRLLQLSNRIYVLHHDLVYGFCSKHFRVITILLLSRPLLHFICLLFVWVDESCFEQALRFALTGRKMSFLTRIETILQFHCCGKCNSCRWVGEVYT